MEKKQIKAVFVCWAAICSQNATVGVFSLPQVQTTVHLALPLYDVALYLALPLLCDNGVQLIFDAVNLRVLPSPQWQLVIVEEGAAVGTDIEVLWMPLDSFHYLEWAWATAHSGPYDADVVLPKIWEDAPACPAGENGH